MNDNKNINNANDNEFKTIKMSNYSSSNFDESKDRKNTGSNLFSSFCCGTLGASLVIGTCFGVPSIREKLFSVEETSSASSFSSETTNSGYVTSVALSDFSDTAVFASNTILPSIVGIQVEFSVESNLSFFNTPTSSTSVASGSGIIISDDGYILTNNHIVDSTSSNSYYTVSEASNVTVKLFGDDTEYEAKIIGKDEQTDLAVIKIEKTGLTQATFADSDSVKVGEFAMAVGNPLGLDNSVTAGIVSAVNRKVADEQGTIFTLIQTDAAINQGNSGGALVNSQGEVIGINTLKLAGTGIEGMGFAIPINSTTNIISDLIEFNKVKRPYIGITGIDLDKELAEKNNLSIGIYVRDIDDFSSAAKGGLKIGDVIIKADGTEITTMNELNDIKNTHNIGDTMIIGFIRNGEEQELELTLGEQP